MDIIRIQLNNLGETEKLGNLLGTLARPGDVICLDGDLGAGKTALSQAIARGLQVPDNCYVSSPSFAIVHEYEGRMPMYHMDFYRLQDASEIEDLGLDEYFYLTGLTVIEWSARATDILPVDRLVIEIVLDDNTICRKVTLKGTARYAQMLQRVDREFNN